MDCFWEVVNMWYMDLHWQSVSSKLVILNEITISLFNTKKILSTALAEKKWKSPSFTDVQIEFNLTKSWYSHNEYLPENFDLILWLLHYNIDILEKEIC